MSWVEPCITIDSGPVVDGGTYISLKVHKIENFFDSDFGISLFLC